MRCDRRHMICQWRWPGAEGRKARARWRKVWRAARLDKPSRHKKLSIWAYRLLTVRRPDWLELRAAAVAALEPADAPGAGPGWPAMRLAAIRQNGKRRVPHPSDRPRKLP